MVNLPPTLSDESITSLCLSLQLPPPESITPLSVAAEYHSIYLLSFPASCASSITSSNKSLKLGLEPDGSVILVLRASARHLPGGYKTRNEVGIMRWIRKNTSIPIPEVIRFDDGENNPIGHEFTLLEKAPGKSVDSIYDDLSDLQKRELVKQLAGYIIELHSPSLRWKSPCVGGLVLDDEDEKVRPGPPIEETFWDQADIDKLWPVGETIESLNPLSQGAFSGYREYIAGSMERYIYAINKHETLAGYRDMVPRLEGFVRGIRASENAELDDIAYVVAHKDLHFANIMCELGENGDDIVITSVLDWEFSGIVPACRWNPVRAFLWNAQRNENCKPEQEKLEKILQEILKREAPHVLREMEPSPKQEAMQKVQSYIRAIVEVCPRGQCADKVDGWRAVAEENLAVLGM